MFDCERMKQFDPCDVGGEAPQISHQWPVYDGFDPNGLLRNTGMVVLDENHKIISIDVVNGVTKILENPDFEDNWLPKILEYFQQIPALGEYVNFVEQMESPTEIEMFSPTMLEISTTIQKEIPLEMFAKAMIKGLVLLKKFNQHVDDISPENCTPEQLYELEREYVICDNWFNVLWEITQNTSVSVVVAGISDNIKTIGGKINSSSKYARLVDVLGESTQVTKKGRLATQQRSFAYIYGGGLPKADRELFVDNLNKLEEAYKSASTAYSNLAESVGSGSTLEQKLFAPEGVVQALLSGTEILRQLAQMAKKEHGAEFLMSPEAGTGLLGFKTTESFLEEQFGPNSPTRQLIDKLMVKIGINDKKQKPTIFEVDEKLQEYLEEEGLGEVQLSREVVLSAIVNMIKQLTGFEVDLQKQNQIYALNLTNPKNSKQFQILIDTGGAGGAISYTGYGFNFIRLDLPESFDIDQYQILAHELGHALATSFANLQDGYADVFRVFQSPLMAEVESNLGERLFFDSVFTSSIDPEKLTSYQAQKLQEVYEIRKWLAGGHINLSLRIAMSAFALKLFTLPADEEALTRDKMVEMWQECQTEYSPFANLEDLNGLGYSSHLLNLAYMKTAGYLSYLVAVSISQQLQEFINSSQGDVSDFYKKVMDLITQSNLTTDDVAGFFRAQ